MEVMLTKTLHINFLTKITSKQDPKIPKITRVMLGKKWAAQVKLCLVVWEYF